MDISDFNSYYVFEKDEHFYLFDIYNLIFMQIEFDLYLYLKKGVNKLEESSIILLDKLKESKLFFYDINDTLNNYINSNNETITFSYPIVHQCNLRCKYCFADTEYIEELDFEEKEELLINICEFIAKTFPGYKYRFELVSGGEPLINKEAFKMVIKTLKKHLDNLSIWVCTNATLLDEEILEFIDENNINFGISLDGDSIQNSSRVYANGKSSYTDVVNKISKIMESKVSRRLKELWGLVVITSQNLNYSQILEHHRLLGFSTVQTKLVRVPEEHYLAINDDRFNEIVGAINRLFLEFMAEINENKCNKLKLILNDNDYIGKIITRLLTKEVVNRRCDAGVNKFSFSNKGEIYPCDSFMESKSYCLGNIKEGFFSDAIDFSNYTIDKRNKCSMCKIRYICGGDCYFNSYIKNGDIEIPDNLFCNVTKHVFESAIVFLEYVKQNNYVIYNRLKKYAKARSIIR